MASSCSDLSACPTAGSCREAASPPLGSAKTADADATRFRFLTTRSASSRAAVAGDSAAACLASLAHCAAVSTRMSPMMTLHRGRASSWICSTCANAPARAQCVGRVCKCQIPKYEMKVVSEPMNGGNLSPATSRWWILSEVRSNPHKRLERGDRKLIGVECSSNAAFKQSCCAVCAVFNNPYKAKCRAHCRVL